MKKVKLIFSIILISIIFSYFMVIFVSRKLSKQISNYSRVEAERFASVIINTSVSEIVNNKKISDELFQLTKNSVGEIEGIDFNTMNVNNILKQVTENIEKHLLEIEEGNTSSIQLSSSLRGNNFPHVKKGVVCEIPMGSVTDNLLLANTGNVIPVKLSFIGKVFANIKTNIKTYGINNAYIETDIEVEVCERVSMPSMTDDIKIVKNIPISMRIIQGKIPDFYNGSIEKNTEDYFLSLE